MEAIQKKERLHLRIEQANEQILDALAAMAETLFQTWQPEVLREETEMSDAEFVAAYEANMRPMTVAELVARAKASDEDIAAGRVHSIEEVRAEFQL